MDRNKAQRSSSAKRTLLAGEQRRRRAFASQRKYLRPSTFRSASTYRNCREARGAGAVPLYRGHPGYGAHMEDGN
ncbi:excalibur calcium-binding domain-containing protein [Alteripontixanthobacter muriae]|uniref:excalibur calcium-binding domain-containing protein n=1 Tax=Alteripontixanthobacter muriae TaxID=2705546 RepID=UPI002FC3B66C